MKTIQIFCGLVLLSQLSLAQTSRDAWDSAFHPKALQQRKERRYTQWLNSWRNRQISADDVKEGWRLNLIQPEPDRLSANYYRVIRENEALEAALAGTNYDFEAQDIADQINIMRLREKGLTTEAETLEKTRLERIRIRQERQFQQEMIARQNEMHRQLSAQIEELRQEVVAAAQAANAARNAAQQSHY